MSEPSTARRPPPLDASTLRRAGREPQTPFSIVLDDGGQVRIYRLLRVLPGKRIVGDGAWAGRRVLVKVFVAQGSARHWAREKGGIEALRAAAIATPELILATALSGGGHVLLTDYLEGARDVGEALRSNAEMSISDNDYSPAESLVAAFSTLGQMHAAGLVQDDLHLGNFLIQGDRVFVIDGDAVCAVSPGRGLVAPRALENLALLLAQLPRTLESALRDELLKAYQTGGGDRVESQARLALAVARWRHWRMKDFLAKTVRDCSLFSVVRGGAGFRAMWRSRSDIMAPVLASPDAVVAEGTLLKDGRTCTVVRIEASGTPLVVKRYNLKNAVHALARCWRPSRAWHSWREGHRLRSLGIATPMPLGLLEERFGPLRRRAFLITEYCPGSDLMGLLSSESEPPGALAEAIKMLFSDLCALRITHGDLKATNLLWHAGELMLIDLDATVLHRSAAAFSRAWRRDRARFLRNWPVSSVLSRWLDRELPPAIGND